MQFLLDDEFDKLSKYVGMKHGIYHLIQQAETGDVQAIFLLGVYFGSENLKDLSDTYLEIAAAKGHEKAKYLLSLD